jgi:ferredoxin
VKRIVINGDLCQGSRECAGIAPAAVDFDDDGIAVATDTLLSDDVARQMESSCPSMAITATDV